MQGLQSYICILGNRRHQGPFSNRQWLWRDNELTRAANIKTFTLKTPIGVQLAVMGSKSVINYGTNTTINVNGRELKQYFGVVNINYYNAILETPFLKKYEVLINFVQDCLKIKEKWPITKQVIAKCQEIIVGYMHAPRSIQMNSCLLFFILYFYFTHSIILIHFYESLFFPIFLSILFSFIRAFIHNTALHICFCFEATRVPRHFGRSRLLGEHLLPHAVTRLLQRFPHVCIR